MSSNQNTSKLALRLVFRSLCFHKRGHLGTFLGAAVASAVLVGALAVGDCVRESLRQMQLARLGKVDFVLGSKDRFFRSELAGDLGFGKEAAAAVLQLAGTAANGDGTARANRVQILGVDEHFWALAQQPPVFQQPQSETVILNAALARQLQVKVGDTVLIRVPKPSFLPADNPLAPREGTSTAYRWTVSAVVSDAQFGRFGLQANQASPCTVFVPLPLLQAKLGLGGKANLLLVAAPEETVTSLSTRLRQHFRLADGEMQLRESPHGLELVSGRVFLDPPVVASAIKAMPDARLISTYFVNELRLGDKSTPYSTITGIGAPVAPAGMRDDEIVVSQWLAEDLSAKAGDELDLSYFVLGETRRLEEKHQRLRVRTVAPLDGEAVDRTLMPEFPGLAKAEKTENWDAGFPLDMKKIRPKDEQYWKERRGTPKAFVTTSAGQRMWGNRFGDLTAIRFPTGSREVIENGILKTLDPAQIGFSFQPVRALAVAARTQSEDFGGLFLSFSFFLIVAALILLAMLFQFGLEKRTEEVGVLLALGLRPRQVRRLLLLEGALLALLGGVVGMVGGIAYARGILLGLTTLWSAAVGASALQFHVTFPTLLMGGGTSVVVCVGVIWLSLRNQAKRPARELLEQGSELEGDEKPGRQWAGWLAILSAAAALALIGPALRQHDNSSVESFFGGGALLLVSGLATAAVWLRSLKNKKSQFTMRALALRGCGRRRKRSLATMALLASGAFLIVAVEANKLDATRDSRARSSGTGGFALIGESALPIVQDLNSEAGREFFGMGALPGVELVPLRVRDGDDASCLNLNRAQVPRLLGVNPGLLQSRNAFTFVKKIADTAQPWLLLKATNALVPAVADDASMVWALGKKIGDTLDYSDERGNTFKVQLVGTVANSILQGSLIIDEAEFIKRFPGESGQRMFLIDAPEGAVTSTAATFTRAMQDYGMEVTTTAQRLEAYNAVQNTYLNTFQLLGGLGLLLGSAGLGAVVLRNVLERRKEWAVLRAVGHRPRTLRWLVVGEHGVLLTAGLLLGIVAALIAVLPALLSPTSQISCGSLAVTLAMVYLSGFLWTWAAASLALRGEVLAALRQE